MALTIAVNITGTPSESDIQAAGKIVREENARRLTDLDQSDPPVPLLPPLPLTPLGALANSYEWCLQELIKKAHADYAEQFKREELQNLRARFIAPTDAQRAAAAAPLPALPS